MRLPIFLPSPSLAEGGTAWNEREGDLAMCGSLLQRKRCLILQGTDAPEGHGGKVLEETIQLYTFELLKSNVRNRNYLNPETDRQLTQNGLLIVR